MNYLEPSYHHYLQHHEQIPVGLSSYDDAQALHNYAMAHQSAAMMPMPGPTKINETKPRLGKDEVEILEREFKRNPKPSTQTKRGFAEDMGVELARINNWFQNRRAKRKQERKQEAMEAGQAQETLGYSEPSSPDIFTGNSYFNDSIVPLQHAATFPMMTGPPPAVASCNPQYPNPSSASMESLQRTFAAAQASQNSSQQGFHDNFLDNGECLSRFGGPLIRDSSHNDHAQFPSPEAAVSMYGSNDSSHPSSYTSNVYAPPSSIVNAQRSPAQQSDHTPTQSHPHTSSGPENPIPLLMTTFPSQLLPPQHQDSNHIQTIDSNDNQSPENSDTSSYALDFRYDIQESEESSMVPPPSSLPFRSPPPPMDIASRRKKVQVKPAALVADTLRGRPQMGPRTVSHAEGFRRQSDSPMPSPMRRIASAGGNRNGMSGRIQKPTFDMAQRSPINFNGFADAEAFMEHNYQNIRNLPIMTAGSSLNSSLAPPTPMSPSHRDLTIGQVEGRKSTVSPTNSGVGFFYNTDISGNFTSVDGDQNLASPPETPQTRLGVDSANNGWPAAVDFQDKQWHFEVPDEPIFTPAQDAFPLDIQMPQPSYLSNMSQPVTPAFGQFNPSLIFGHESPKYQSDSPSYSLSAQNHAEYTFPESHHHLTLGMLSSPMNKQKTFQFSNTTAADFSEKQ